jgi:hypothetical protein
MAEIEPEKCSAAFSSVEQRFDLGQGNCCSFVVGIMSDKKVLSIGRKPVPGKINEHGFDGCAAKGGSQRIDYPTTSRFLVGQDDNIVLRKCALLRRQDFGHLPHVGGDGR